MAEVMKIRVNSGITVEVNDNGDTICVNADDQCFLEKYYSLIDTLESAQEYGNSEEYAALDNRAKANAVVEQMKRIMADIDTLFGENACKKIFGDIVPNPFLIADFLSQMKPIIAEYSKQRQSKISQKYSRQRKGSK